MLSSFNLPSIRLKNAQQESPKTQKWENREKFVASRSYQKNYVHYSDPFILKMIYLTAKLYKKSKYLQIDCFAGGKMPGYQEGFQALAKQTF